MGADFLAVDEYRGDTVDGSEVEHHAVAFPVFRNGE